MSDQEIVLSSDQEEVFAQTLGWVDSHNPLLRFGGLAGTGKTTLLAALAKHVTIQKSVAFCALTGRAASVLANKLAQQGMVTGTNVDAQEHYCGTIHGLLYTPKYNKKTGELLGWSKRQFLSHQLIVVDEASMVPREIFEDLKRLGVPILAVGDHGQLAPVGGHDFNLMDNPDIRLEKIHRQAENNPIIQLAAEVRRSGMIDPQLADGTHVRVVSSDGVGPHLQRLFRQPAENVLDTAVLCYTNRTRVEINKRARALRFGYTGVPEWPVRDDVVVCLRNLHDYGIYNGFRGFYTNEPRPASTHWVKGTIDFPLESRQLTENVSRYHFMRSYPIREFSDLAPFCPRSWKEVGPLFDYGYGLTVHKAQGSQFSDVVLFSERPRKVDPDEYKRWLYTAVTRASERLVVVRPART